MNFLLRNLLDRYDLLTIRERSLVLVAVLVLIAVAWQSLFAAPRARERAQRKQQVEALRAEVSGLEQGIQVMAEQGQLDPDGGLIAEIAKLKQEVPELDARLAGATTGLIGPKEMTQVLRQLLQRASRLEVGGLRTIPATPVMVEAQENGVVPGAKIYKHGLELELAGGYLDVLHFLQSMESLQWRFFWDQIELQVEQYPRARVRLVVYTLSLEEGWIGV